MAGGSMRQWWPKVPWIHGNTWKIQGLLSTGSDASDDFLFTFYHNFRTRGKQLQEGQHKKQYTRWWFRKCLFFSPRKLGKLSNLANIFSDGLKTNNQYIDLFIPVLDLCTAFFLSNKASTPYVFTKLTSKIQLFDYSEHTQQLSLISILHKQMRKKIDAQKIRCWTISTSHRCHVIHIPCLEV